MVHEEFMKIFFALPMIQTIIPNYFCHVSYSLSDSYKIKFEIFPKLVLDTILFLK